MSDATTETELEDDALVVDTDPDEAFLEMSDADFMNKAGGMMPAAATDAPAPDHSEHSLEDMLDGGEQAEEGDVEEAEKTDPEDLVQAPGHTTPKQTAAAQGNPKAVASNGDGGAAQAPAGGAEAAPSAPAAGAAENGAEPDYKALYQEVMATFKANGQDFTPSSPEEVKRLMQMGVNYTRKMQGLAPHLKIVRMLENNGLLDENKIAYLIDLDQKNPGAVQKLIKDSEIDPLDIDPSAEPTYTPGNHTVTDEEMAFRETLDSVVQTEEGIATVKLIDTWDAASKREVYQAPSLLETFTQQRSNGIFAAIDGEIKRRRILGQLTNVPYIAAYKTVGDELHARGELHRVLGLQAPQPGTTAPQQQPAQRVETRPAKSAKAAATDAQVRALGAAPSNAQKAPPRAIDPLAMSDEEIMAFAKTRR